MASELHHDERITAFGLFAEAYTGLVARLSGQLAEHGLSLIEFEVLIRLARSPERRLRMTELAGQVALTTSGITRVVDRLERDTLVRRQACPNDRRGSWAVLGEVGLDRVTAALPGHLALLERHFIDRFPPAELALLVSRFRDIRDELNPQARPSAETERETPDETGRTGGRNPRSTDRAPEPSRRMPANSVITRR
jgi:DNA-binding MarR family transcriptional regulator